MGGSGNGVRNRITMLRIGLAVGAWGVATAVAAGLGANMREAGFGVAPELAGHPLHFRASILVFSGCLAPLLGILWGSLSCDVPSISEMRSHVRWALILSAAFPIAALVANYTIVVGLTTAHVAVIPAAIALAVSVLYALVVRPLSGKTGVGLATRLTLRSSMLWLICFAGIQFMWTVIRVIADDPSLLWYVERPAIELGLLGFCVMGALGTLMACLSGLYHSRNTTQAVIRAHYPLNALLLAWTLIGVWSMRFPGGYHDLASPVIAIALLVFFAIIADASDLLDLRRIWSGGRGHNGPVSPDLRLASLVMVLLVCAGVVLTIDATTRVALGKQPLHPLLGSLVMAVGLGIVPLTASAVVASLRERLGALLSTASVLLAAGAFTGLLLRPAWGLTERIMEVLTSGAEIMSVVGMLLIAVAAFNVTLSED